MSKNSSLKEAGHNLRPKIFCSDSPGENIWHKVKKFSKIGQDFKNVLSNFPGFFDSKSQTFISGWKTGH